MQGSRIRQLTATVFSCAFAALFFTNITLAQDATSEIFDLEMADKLLCLHESISDGVSIASKTIDGILISDLINTSLSTCGINSSDSAVEVLAHQLFTGDQSESFDEATDISGYGMMGSESYYVSYSTDDSGDCTADEGCTDEEKQAIKDAIEKINEAGKKEQENLKKLQDELKELNKEAAVMLTEIGKLTQAANNAKNATQFNNAIAKLVAKRKAYGAKQEAILAKELEIIASNLKIQKLIIDKKLQQALLNLCG